MSNPLYVGGMGMAKKSAAHNISAEGNTSADSTYFSAGGSNSSYNQGAHPPNQFFSNPAPHGGLGGFGGQPSNHQMMQQGAYSPGIQGGYPNAQGGYVNPHGVLGQTGGLAGKAPTQYVPLVPSSPPPKILVESETVFPKPGQAANGSPGALLYLLAAEPAKFEGRLVV